MNAKITLKSLGNDRGYAKVLVQLDENRTEQEQTQIENIVIVDGELAITIDEIENRLVETKSNLYHNGEGLHLHQIYLMATKSLVAEKLPRKWRIM